MVVHSFISNFKVFKNRNKNIKVFFDILRADLWETEVKNQYLMILIMIHCFASLRDSRYLIFNSKIGKTH